MRQRQELMELRRSANRISNVLSFILVDAQGGESDPELRDTAERTVGWQQEGMRFDAMVFKGRRRSCVGALRGQARSTWVERKNRLFRSVSVRTEEEGPFRDCQPCSRRPTAWKSRKKIRVHKYLLSGLCQAGCWAQRMPLGPSRQVPVPSFESGHLLRAKTAASWAIFSLHPSLGHTGDAQKTFGALT